MKRSSYIDSLPPSGGGLGWGGKAHWLAITLIASVVGCGSAATVSGKVTYQGRPVVYGSVILLGADNIARSGSIGPDGSFVVVGVSPGEVKIGVISRDPSKSRGIQRQERKAGSGKKEAEPAETRAWFPLPRALEDPAGSGIVVTVGSGRVKQDIELN